MHTDIQQISPEKQLELSKMQERLRVSLADPEVREMVKADYVHTFKELGLSDEDADELCETIFSKMRGDEHLNFIEAEVLEHLDSVRVNGRSLPEILDEKLAARAEIIYSQVGAYFEGFEGKILDFGCGDGQVTQKLADELEIDIEGFDVRHYPAPHVSVRIQEFDGRTLPVKNGYYDAALVTNVFHHDPENDKALAELTRVVENRIVVIETVPIDESPAQRSRTFMNDYLYNRLFHNADVPVPGTFETKEQWPSRFEKHGWKLIGMTDLGYDQPTIRDWHVLYVFERSRDVDNVRASVSTQFQEIPVDETTQSLMDEVVAVWESKS